jgi:TonB family protein
MKVLIIIFMVFINLSSKGQNLFLIGEKSYPCTNAITLEANSGYFYEDLDVFLAKDGNSGAIAVNRKSNTDELFFGKLIIYLKDGNVLTCGESEASERVDDIAKALYNLTTDQLNKLKDSNIHTIKYTLYRHGDKNDCSASNKDIETHKLISEFFNAIEKPSNIDSLENRPPAPPVLEEPKEEEPFAYVEQMPTFPDGTEAMYKYIYENIKYPAIAGENGISGQVIIQFVVSKEGDLQKAKVVRGIGGGCNEEALRVVNSMPKWKPGKHNGQNVPVTFTLPIKFVNQ